MAGRSRNGVCLSSIIYHIDPISPTISNQYPTPTEWGFALSILLDRATGRAPFGADTYLSEYEWAHRIGRRTIPTFRGIVRVRYYSIAGY